MSPEEIAELVEASPPGTYWYVGGEPNTTPTNVNGTDFADVFNHYYTYIKAADPMAKVMSPSILNWWFECTGCGGYQLGKDWVDEFRTAYKAKYEQEPPVDVWSIDLYPLDWLNTPTVNSDLVIDQIGGGRHPYLPGQPFFQGMRAYLEAIPEYRDTPIWVTEVALHWGYSGWKFREPFDPQNPLEPTGSYCEREVTKYLLDVLDWLATNAQAYGIERWFQFITYADIANQSIQAYADITLFDQPDVGASLGLHGEIYRDKAKGLIPNEDLQSLPSCS